MQINQEEHVSFTRKAFVAPIYLWSILLSMNEQTTKEFKMVNILQ